MSANTFFVSVWLLNNCSKSSLLCALFWPFEKWPNDLELRIKFGCNETCYVYLTNKEAYAVYMYYTVIKHDGHLTTQRKWRILEPQASVFYISRVFSNVWSVLSQCNTRLSLLHLFYDIDFSRREQKQHSTQIDKLTHFLSSKVFHPSSSKLSGCYAKNFIPNFFKIMFFAPSLTKMLTIICDE